MMVFKKLIPVERYLKQEEEEDIYLKREESPSTCARCLHFNAPPLRLPCGKKVFLCNVCANDFRIFLDLRIDKVIFFC